MDQNREAQKSTCHLLELPAELRKRIYRMWLVSDNLKLRVSVQDTKIYGEGKEDYFTFWTGCLPPEHSLLCTCKTIRKEGQSIWYGENIIHLSVAPGPTREYSWGMGVPTDMSTRVLWSFVKRLRPEQMKAMRTLRQGKVFHAFKPTRTIAVHESDVWMTCRLTAENKMEISLEEHAKPDYPWNYPIWEDCSEAEHSNLVRCFCTCDLRSAAHVGATHLGEESSLIRVAKAFVERYDGELRTTVCATCELVKLG